MVPDTLQDVDFMVRDSKRFSDTANWGYAEFDYEPRPTRSRHCTNRRQLRIRMPYDSGGERLRLHRVPGEVSGGRRFRNGRPLQRRLPRQSLDVVALAAGLGLTMLDHDFEKWKPIFGQDHAQNKEI